MKTCPAYKLNKNFWPGFDDAFHHRNCLLVESSASQLLSTLKVLPVEESFALHIHSDQHLQPGNCRSNSEIE
jgi:hypothetical protein